MSDFMEILRREVAAKSVKKVAEEIGYKRPSVSLLLHGKYPGKTDRIGAKIFEVYAQQIACPHLRQTITPLACKEARERPMPTNNARELRHWTACKSCPLNPAAKAAPSEPTKERIS